MSKAFLPLGILAAAGVMGSLAGGQGSPARRRYIRPEVEEHYIQGVRDPAFVLGLTRPQQLALWWYANTLSGPQAVRIQEIVELHQAGELPTVDRDWVNPSHPGRSARGRRAKIHPVTGLERRGEFHYFKLGTKAYREGAARKDNPFKGWQAKWWDKGWAGVRPRRQRGRAARGRRARKSAFERNVEGVWESDADQRARIRAGLNWISLRQRPSFSSGRRNTLLTSLVGIFPMASSGRR